MQVRTLKACLNQAVNTSHLIGYSSLWENEKNGAKDSKFWVWVGVEISDHPATTDKSEHTLHATVYVADQVVTSKLLLKRIGISHFLILSESVNITVKRDASVKDREKTVRPFLDFSLERVRPAGASSSGTIMYRVGYVDPGSQSHTYFI